MKITKWLGASLLVGILLPLSPLMAESLTLSQDLEKEFLSDSQIASQFWDLAWNLKYAAETVPYSRPESVKVRSDRLIEFVEKYKVDTTSYRFRSSAEYVLESGDEDAVIAVLNMGFSDKIYKGFISETASKLKIAHRYKYGDDDDYKSWKRYGRSMDLLLAQALERGISILPDDTLKNLHPEASIQLVKLLARFSIGQKEVDETFNFYRSRYFGSDQKDALDKLQALMNGQTPPSRTVVEASFNLALDEKKPATDVAVFFSGIGQEEMDAALGKFLPYLLKSPELQKMFVSKQLELRVDEHSSETPLSRVVATHLDSSADTLVSGLEFVMTHYEVSGREADSLAVRRLINTGSEQLYAAAQSISGIETVFADVLEENVGQLLKMARDDSRAAAHRKVIRAIVATSYELDYDRYVEPLAQAGHVKSVERLLSKLSDEQLSGHESVLVVMAGIESVREFLIQRNFRFKGVRDGSPETAFKKALALYNEQKSDHARASLSFVLQYSDISDSSEDMELLTAAMRNTPFLFRKVIRGVPGLEALQHEAVIIFVQALTELRVDEAEAMLGYKDTESRKPLLAKLPSPSDGFESLICSFGANTGLPKDAPVEKAFELVTEWASALEYPLVLDTITECTLGERSVLRKMSNAQLGQILKILHKNDWDLTVRSNRTLFTKVEQRVLDYGLQYLTKAHEEASSALTLRTLFGYFNRLVGKGGGAKVLSHLLPLAEAVTSHVFKDLTRAELLIPFVDYLLPLYPDDLYQEYLKEIYRSDNVGLLAYVLSNPGHQSRFRSYSLTVLSGRMSDFDEELLSEKTALLVHSCIVPGHSENHLVSVAIQQCHGSLLLLGADAGSSLVESCSVDRGECNPSLTEALSDSVKDILGRKPLVSSWVGQNNKQE